jgi:acyl-CoA oxidase
MSVQEPNILETESAGLLQFLPMLYVAWVDGTLSDGELQRISGMIEKQKWLTKDEKKTLKGWLNPEKPPSTVQLQLWLDRIKALGEEMSEGEKRSLAELGRQIARAGAGDDYSRCATPEACAALDEIEAAFGIIGYEAVNEMAGMETPAARETASVITPFDAESMMNYLDGAQIEIRQRIRKLLTSPLFSYRYDLKKSRYRKLVYTWLIEIARQKIGAISFPRNTGGEGDLAKFMAAFETLTFHDMSLAIKFGVQFGLFGGSILHLGTKPHHDEYLGKVGTLELPGCFAMTELGHGSNVRDIETTADYERETQQFIINTPREAARKEYIGNAAEHGKMATVFAQLRIDGQEFGVHAFLVPIRGRLGRPKAGVRIDDCGDKMGLNGVDNGRLWFDHVRVPRANLLNRFADVNPEGHYTSAIASPSKRFFTMLGTLVGGRISISAAGLSAAKSALTIAVRYACERRQFGPAGQRETLIVDYPSHQRRLFPLVATAYAIDFAQKYVTTRYVNKTDDDAREVETISAGLKVFSTWNATETIQQCREACGGQGYLAENRFASLKADSDVFATFEGDNTVLIQLVAKGLLTDFKQHFHETKVFGVLRYIAQRAATAITEMNPVTVRNTDEAHLHDPEFHLAAFHYREDHLLATVAQRLKSRIDKGMDSHAAFLECQSHLIKLGHAHIERVVLEQFREGVEKAPTDELRESLDKLCCLFALFRIERDHGWFMESGYLEGNKSKAIRSTIDRLCSALRQNAVALVDAFGIPNELLAAPIAMDNLHD